MLSLCRHLWTAILLAVCGLAAASVAADRLEEFRDAKRDVLQLYRSKQSADRIKAVKKLSEFALEDSVRMIYAALDDPAPEVRQVAYHSLEEMNGNLEVCETLLTLARRAAHSKGQGPQAAAAPIAILLSSKLRSTRRDVETLLNDGAKSREGVPLVIALVDELAARHEPGDVVPLEHLTNTEVFAASFGVRRTIVHALTRIPTKEAVGVLIGILDRVGGEARADAIEYLVPLTQQIFGMETAAWQRWWEESKDTFKYPTVTVRASYRTTLTESEGGSYYEMPIFAERLVFVLDTSGSMSGQRITAAQRELVQAIEGLPDYAQFGIIVFNSDVHAWQRQLVPANEQNKRSAIGYVNSQHVAASTASYDALEAAFAYDTEAIYFLSDGAPTSGKFVAPVDIVSAITAQNQSRRISVYTIGVGAGFPGSPLDVFLHTLADQNLGLYRRVDN